MKRALFLSIIAALLCSCVSDHIQEEINNAITNPDEPLQVMFTFERQTPLMIEFINLSSGCTSYKWDFGDGTWASGRDAIHEYESMGTYTVTLTGSNGKETKKFSQNITLKKPKCYIVGYTIYQIPYESNYYRLVFKDDALLPSSWDFKTDYTPQKLTSSDLPYSAYISPIKLIEDPESHDYWTIQLVRSSSTSGSETNCLKGKLTRADLLKYKPEYIWRSESGTTSFSIHMEYAY